MQIEILPKEFKTWKEYDKSKQKDSKKTYKAKLKLLKTLRRFDNSLEGQLA